MYRKLFIILALLASPASGSSLFLDDGGSATLGPGDVLDQVILTDTSHLTMNTGAEVGEITLLDFSTADLFGASVLDSLEVFEDAVVNVYVDVGALVDGNPAPGQLLAGDCPTCTATGLYQDGDTLNLGIEIAQNGQVNLIAIPEPMTASLFGLGLLGLGMLGWRRS